MRHRLSPLCLTVSLLIAATGARAEVELIEQWRRLDVDVEVYDSEDSSRGYVLLGSKSESVESPGWGWAAPSGDHLFDRSLNVEIDAYPDPFNNISHGSASQRSAITPSRFEGSGFIHVYAESDQHRSSASGASRYDVTFRVEEPQRLDLNYELFGDDFYGAGFDGHVRLTHLLPGDLPDVVLMERQAFDVSQYRDETWDYAFTTGLPEGVYRFEFFMSQDTDLGTGFGYAFQADFTPVPEPGAAGLGLAAGAVALLRRPRRGGV